MSLVIIALEVFALKVKSQLIEANAIDKFIGIFLIRLEFYISFSGSFQEGFDLNYTIETL